MALQHTYEKAFSVENGMRRNVPKIVVAITDGRSQDEVKKSSAKLQHAGTVPYPYLLLNDTSLYCLTPTCSLMTLSVLSNPYLLLNDLSLYCLTTTCSLMTCLCTV